MRSTWRPETRCGEEANTKKGVFSYDKQRGGSTRKVAREGALEGMRAWRTFQSRGSRLEVKERREGKRKRTTKSL